MRRLVARALLCLFAANAPAYPQSTASGGVELPEVIAPGPGPVQIDAGRIDRFEFDGNKVLPNALLQAAASPYRGRQLNAAQVEELREVLTRQYTDRGYINSGVIVDTDTPHRQGVLHFRVIEGRITQVRVHGLKRLLAAYVVNRLRGARHETFNVNRLRERFQRLLDDPLFARLNCQILPGARLGEAILDVEVERGKSYAVSAALNNYRPPSIGEKGYVLSGLVRDLTGWGDVLDASLSGPADYSGGVSYSAGWQIPLNRYYTAVSFRTSFADSVVTEQPLEALDIRSQITRQELKLSQPLWASLTQQLNLGVSVAYEKDSTSLAGIPFSFLPGAHQGVTRAVASRLAPDYSYRTEHEYLGLRVTLLHAWLLDQSTSLAAFNQPDHSYWVSTAQLHHLLEIPNTPLELETRATVQWTGAHISDLHALEIGGVDSVRGFRENELLLANVDNLNVDFRWLALPAGNGRFAAMTLGTFFDWANGHDVDEPIATFSSTGVTLRLKWSSLQFDLAMGARLIRPSFVEQQRGSWQDAGMGIHAQIAAAL